MYYLYGDAMKKYIKKYWIYGAVTCALIIAMLIPKQIAPEIDAITSSTVEIETVEEHIYVDLKGFIKNPGVYKLEKNTRLFQVINLAGGLQDEADSLAINMSMELKDQMSIYIPSIHDNLPMVVTPIDDPDDFLIDINQAGVLLLQSLPGIGPSTAQNIVDYRDESGYFDVIEDLLNVPNIGEATFDEIKDLITITK